MTPVLEIGLPDLSGEDLERLAEACEEKVTEYILSRVPEKSIEELNVTCILSLADQLDLDLDIAISQKYDTGEDLELLIDDAVSQGIRWLETRLLEMKNR